MCTFEVHCLFQPPVLSHQIYFQIPSKPVQIVTIKRGHPNINELSPTLSESSSWQLSRMRILMFTVIRHESKGKSLPHHTRFYLNETCHISPLRTILRQRLNEDNVLKYDTFFIRLYWKPQFTHICKYGRHTWFCWQYKIKGLPA